VSIPPLLSTSARSDSETSLGRRIGHPGAPEFSVAGLRHASGADQSSAVGAQFEAILVRQLLGPTMASMLGGEGGAVAGVYGDLLASTMASQLTAGRGLGLGRMLESQLTARGAAPEQPSSLP
jgi:Rod binding domain-containing protein